MTIEIKVAICLCKLLVVRTKEESKECRKKIKIYNNKIRKEIV